MGVLLRYDDVAVKDRNAEGVDVVDVVAKPALLGISVRGGLQGDGNVGAWHRAGDLACCFPVRPHIREVAATSLQRLVESVEEFDDDLAGHDDIAEPAPSPLRVCVQARDLGSLLSGSVLSYLPDGFWIPPVRSQPLDPVIGRPSEHCPLSLSSASAMTASKRSGPICWRTDSVMSSPSGVRMLRPPRRPKAPAHPRRSSGSGRSGFRDGPTRIVRTLSSSCLKMRSRGCRAAKPDRSP
jgi:hypothetical protein